MRKLIDIINEGASIEEDSSVIVPEKASSNGLPTSWAKTEKPVTPESAALDTLKEAVDAYIAVIENSEHPSSRLRMMKKVKEIIAWLH